MTAKPAENNSPKQEIKLDDLKPGKSDSEYNTKTSMVNLKPGFRCIDMNDEQNKQEIEQKRKENEVN